MFYSSKSKDFGSLVKDFHNASSDMFDLFGYFGVFSFVGFSNRCEAESSPPNRWEGRG